MTKRTLERIEKENVKVFNTIKNLKDRHNQDKFNHDIIHSEIRGYLVALRDTGFITESERKCLFCYITL